MEVSTVVVDNGGSSIRAGIGGDSEPQTVMPNIIGRPPKILPGTKEVYVGSEAFSQRGITFNCPIENKVIKNFDDIEKIWSHIFEKEMNLNMEEHPILMTESFTTQRSSKEKAVQIMMETFKVPAYYSTSPSLLSLYASGITTGVTIDAGESMTTILPIYESFSMTHVNRIFDAGGKTINSYLSKLLQQECSIQPSIEAVRNIKEKYCYIAENPKEETNKYEHSSENDVKYEAPDGTSMVIKSQRFRCTELFFQPELINLNSKSLTQLIIDAITESDEDLRKEFYGTIVLSGGSSMFKGFGERIEKNLAESAPHDYKVKVIAPENRKNSAWIGGSQLVSLATFSQMWITRAEYDETGPQIVNLKCF